MPGNAIVAATEETLMMLPPLPASPSGRMVRKPALEAESGAEDVDLQHRADVLRVHLDDQAGDLDAGVVDQDVEPAEVGGGGGGGVLPARLVGDVEVHEAVALALERVGHLLAEVVLQVRDDDAGAGSGERLRHPLPESLGCLR